jgi:hypothetical protein
MTYTYHHLIRDLRMGRFTSLGSYPVFFLASDGETLSPQAVLDNVWLAGRSTRDRDNNEWCIIGCEVNWEAMDMVCAHTGERIECAYPSEVTP